MINASIVLYKTKPESLEKAIVSLVRSKLINKIFLVDNSPTDYLKQFETKDERVVYIFNGKNLGYGRANNIAMKETLKEEIGYHLVLNPDVWFESGVLETLHEFMEKESSVGLVMPMVKSPSGEIQYLCRLLPTPFDLFLRRLWPFKSIFKDRLSKHELRCSGYSAIMEVPFLSGCFMLLRASALRKCGLFDERYFLYCDDLDLCRRIGLYYKTVFFPYVEVYHEWGRGSYKSLKLLLKHTYDCFKYFNKYGWFKDSYRDNINSRALKKLC